MISVTEGFLILNKEVRIELPNSNSGVETYNVNTPNSVFNKAVVVTVPYKQGLYNKLYALIGVEDVEMEVGIYRNKEEVLTRHHIQITNIELNKVSISFTFHFTNNFHGIGLN